MAVPRLVAHIRELRPEIVVTHDAYGGLTGHPDHVQTHRLTVLAAQVPDEQVTTTMDVTPWLETKVAAVLAHRSEVERGALPGLIAGLSPDTRRTLLSTEWYIRGCTHAPAAGEVELLPRPQTTD